MASGFLMHSFAQVHCARDGLCRGQMLCNQMHPSSDFDFDTALLVRMLGIDMSDNRCSLWGALPQNIMSLPP